MIHDFYRANNRGLTGELRVIAHLEAHGFVIERVTTLREQFEGFDLYATSPNTRERKRIEIKTDFAAKRTGNAVVEMVSNDVSGRPGWVHTTTADFVLYLVDGLDVLYWLTPATLRANLPRWERDYRAYAAPNRGYHTRGVLIPLHEFETLAIATVSL